MKTILGKPSDTVNVVRMVGSTSDNISLTLGEKVKVTLLAEPDCKVVLDEIMAVECMLHEKTGDVKHGSAFEWRRVGISCTTTSTTLLFT